MQAIKWTDRKFNFGYEKGYVPFFIERLRSTAPRMEELLQHCSEAGAAETINNRWSAKEHVGHLADLERLHDGRIDDLINGAHVLRAADMNNKETYAANHNDRNMSEQLSHFRSVREQFIRRVETLDDKYFELTALHPRLQQVVTLTDLLFFIAEHDVHHLYRIAELVRTDS